MQLVPQLPARAVGTNKGSGSFTRGGNYRMTQAQAVMPHSSTSWSRTQSAAPNADYLSANLGTIPGITPVRPEPGGVASLSEFRYDAGTLNGLSARLV